MIYIRREEQGELESITFKYQQDNLLACVFWFLNLVKLLPFHLDCHDLLTDLITASQLLILINAKTRTAWL